MSDGRMSIRNSTGHVVTLDDAAMTIAIGDEQGDNIVFDAKNRLLTVEVRAGVTITVAGGNVAINAPAGGVTLKGGTARIEAAAITLACESLVLGDASATPLANESLLQLFNNHHHLDPYGVPTSAPTAAASAGVHSTTRVRGA